MPEPNRPLKVFLSYASQDKSLVRELSRRLIGEGWIDTWQDEKNLLPGQDWRVKIEEAVEDADVVVIVLSQHSVSKEGHVQKELRYTREIALEKPEDAIFLIPLRLDECEVPRGLRFYQWVDYFGDNKDSSYKALVASLNLRYKQKIKAEEAEGIRKELQEREFAEKIAREKAEKDAGEKARLKAEEEERQRNAKAKEKAEREAANKLAREKAEKETAEKARLLAEEKERQKITKEKEDREQKIKEARLKKERETDENARHGVASGGKTKQVKEEVKPGIPNPNSGNQVIYWVGGFALLVFVMIFFSSLNTPSTSSQPTPYIDQSQVPIITTTNSATKLSTEVVNSNNVAMVLIPEGEFEMGSSSEAALKDCQMKRTDCDIYWFKDVEPSHTVYLDAYYIDKYEVTNGLYELCVTDGKCDPPQRLDSRTRSSYYGNVTYDNYPVMFVDWEQAKTYCNWRDARLPTEAEWEKAARGTDGRTYPWGEEIDCTKANYWDEIKKAACEGDTTEVGKYSKGVSPYGVYDMAGNVWEWVNDWYDDSYYQNSSYSNPVGPDSGDGKVLRGGSFLVAENNQFTYTRSEYSYALFNSDWYGFRCAKDANP